MFLLIYVYDSVEQGINRGMTLQVLSLIKQSEYGLDFCLRTMIMNSIRNGI